MQTLAKVIRCSVVKNQTRRNFSILLTPKEAKAQMLEKKPVILHSSSLPKEHKADVYTTERIPGARFFDLDIVSTVSSDLPRRLPLPHEFSERMKKIGVNATDEVIVYDDNGIMGATRALWMLNVYGNFNVKIIDGGFNEWKEQRKPTENGEETWVDNYHQGGKGFELQKELVANIHEVREFAYGQAKDMELLDGREPEAFRGETSDSNGHIPFSKNIHYKKLLEKDSNKFKQPEELKQIFENHDVDLNKNIICSCKDAMAATVLYTALRILGRKDVAVYDGAWEEWAKFPENESVRGGHEPAQTAPAHH